MSVSVLKPPRLTGSPAKDSVIINDYLFQLFNSLIVQSRIIERLDAISELATIASEISDPPTKEEVEALRDKINAIINAATI